MSTAATSPCESGAAGVELSVLVPARDTGIDALLQCLGEEVRAHRLPVEVRVFDDASAAPALARSVAAVQRARDSGVSIKLLRTEVNLGRAAARNALAGASRGRLLLFLDADVLPDRPDFLRRYLALPVTTTGAVCGGISYQQCGRVAPTHRFYRSYSGTASVAPAAVRQRNPWAWLFTANVLVARSTFERVPFDPGFGGYGYEDIEWGLRLHAAGLLEHVDNTVSHMGLLSKAVLARKSAEAAPNLVRLWRLHPEHAQRLGLLRAASAMAVLPTPLLRAAAAAAGRLFVVLPGPYALEWALYQTEKLCRSALAWRAAGASRSGPGAA